tara:strand:- start:75429 stop:75572 length:144 start_codon:yes stop_codon:yes gene_type:complete
LKKFNIWRAEKLIWGCHAEQKPIFLRISTNGIHKNFLISPDFMFLTL